MRIPPDHTGWWNAERQLWWRDFDSLGHLTASAYPTIYHDVFADFVNEAWGTSDSSYVAARIAVEYLHEVRPDEGPVSVHVELRRVGRSGFDASMVLVSGSGRVCSTAEASFAAWDGGARSSRALTRDERAGLLALGDRSGRLSGRPR